MNIENLHVLTQEIEYYKSSDKHAECIQRIDQHEKETSDPVVRAILLIAKAKSALHLQNIALADESLSRVEVASLTGSMQNYVNLTKATTAHMGGRLAEADRLASMILASQEIHNEEQRDVLYEALAQKGFVQADLNQFGVALELLDMASTVVGAEGLSENLSENIAIYEAYCLQALGRLDEAEECLRHVLSRPGNLRADAYYRLGAIELQKEEFAAAKFDFQNALNKLSGGRLRREDVLSALREAESGLAQFKRFDTH
jgi:tetratricopeptide (TPR) repeat protein